MKTERAEKTGQSSCAKCDFLLSGYKILKRGSGQPWAAFSPLPPQAVPWLVPVLNGGEEPTQTGIIQLHIWNGGLRVAAQGMALDLQRGRGWAGS